MGSGAFRQAKVEPFMAQIGARMRAGTAAKGPVAGRHMGPEGTHDRQDSVHHEAVAIQAPSQDGIRHSARRYRCMGEVRRMTS